MTGHFEGKKHAVRQTQDGWVVSFVVHPNDMNADFATAPLGTRYMVGFAEIGDDERPAQPLTGRVDEGSDRGTPTSSPNNNAKSRYQSQTSMERARDRAGMLSGDPRFQEWVGDESGGDEIATAAYIRAVCGVVSRSEIATDIDAYDKFIRMETLYRVDTGQIAEQRR